jgi:hypothetical protein
VTTQVEVDPVRRTGSLGGFGGFLGVVTVPVGFGLGGAGVEESRVESPRVEPAFDTADQIAPGLGASALVGELTFGVPKLTGYVVVPARPCGTHRLGHPGVLAQLGELG